jgi:hypothetical protein
MSRVKVAIIVICLAIAAYGVIYLVRYKEVEHQVRQAQAALNKRPLCAGNSGIQPAVSGCPPEGVLVHGFFGLPKYTTTNID